MTQPAPETDSGRFERFVSTVSDGPLAGSRYEVRYRRTGGPPVIVLHEILGPSPATVDLAVYLSQRRPPFSTYVPVVFGRFARGSPTGLVRSKLCLRREFTLLLTGRTSPVVTWIRQLVDEVSERHAGERVAVIGMCLTGGFVFGLLGHPKLAAGVASQPSLPVPLLRGLLPRVQADLGTTSTELIGPPDQRAELTVLRYRGDWLCPTRRADSIAAVFGPAGEPVPDPQDPRLTVRSGEGLRLIEVDGPGHSVLTVEPVQRARQLVATALDEAFATPAEGADAT